MRAGLINRVHGADGKVAFRAFALIAATLFAQSAVSDELLASTQAIGAQSITPQFAATKRHHATHAPLHDLCVFPSANPECAAAFTAALKSTEEAPDVVVTATGEQSHTRLKGVAPLRFQKRAPWVRRLETIGKEGIPFVRMPRGPEKELIIGINRKGVLGFQLKQTSNR